MRRKNDKPGLEEGYIRIIHTMGINIGVLTLSTSSLIVFILAFIKFIGMLVYLPKINIGRISNVLSILGVEKKPLVLVFIDIIDTSILASILLILAFGLRAVFMGKRYKVVAFDIRDIDELKEYLIGLVITLMSTRFLERMLKQGIDSNILGPGIGMAALILALGGYDFILKQHKRGY
ncbi:MAG: YqhA family protein [bacterium]|jgi:uncharacterized membrane protein YqhA|nr:YqhA family protein [bacterium]MDD4153614.1 YqhA family protein [bacterium]